MISIFLESQKITIPDSEVIGYKNRVSCEKQWWNTTGNEKNNKWTKAMEESHPMIKQKNIVEEVSLRV